MKTRRFLKKTTGVLLCFSMIFGLLGCDITFKSDDKNTNQPSSNENIPHPHKYTQYYDDTNHYLKCSCGHISNTQLHDFSWVVDTMPTYIAPGYKHQKCNTCGYITKISTIIDRLLHEEVLQNVTIKNKSSMYSQKTFNNQEQLLSFLSANNEILTSSFLCVNATSDPKKKIYIHDEENKISYVFSYDFNVGDINSNNQSFENPLVTVSYCLYCEEFGSVIDKSDLSAPLISLSFLMVFGEINDQIINPTFEFYKYDNGAMNYIIKVKNNEKCIGEILYYTNLDISREWIVDYITENMSVIS